MGRVRISLEERGCESMVIFSTDRANDEFDYRKNLSHYDHVEITETDRFYKNDKSLMEYLIPSKSMREYHKKIGYEYTEQAIAAMITWSRIPYFMKVDELKKIEERCSDENLKKQLMDYIDYLEYSYKSFVCNDEKKYIYILNIQWDEESDFEENGYFLNYRDAIEFSKKSGRVEKRIDKIRLVRNYDDYKDIEENYIFSDAGWIGFDDDGEVLFCESYDVPKPEYSKDTFHTMYIKIPYPFRHGDIVRVLSDHNRLGVVNGYKTDEEIEADYERLKDIIDFSDFQVCVESYFYNSDNDTLGWAHQHISPVNLEFANIDRDNIENGSEEDLMLTASALVKGESAICGLEYTEYKFKERLRKNRYKS